MRNRASRFERVRARTSNVLLLLQIRPRASSSDPSRAARAGARRRRDPRGSVRPRSRAHRARIDRLLRMRHADDRETRAPRAAARRRCDTRRRRRASSPRRARRHVGELHRGRHALLRLKQRGQPVEPVVGHRRRRRWPRPCRAFGRGVHARQELEERGLARGRKTDQSGAQHVGSGCYHASLCFACFSQEKKWRSKDVSPGFPCTLRLTAPGYLYHPWTLLEPSGVKCFGGAIPPRSTTRDG